MYDLGPYFKFDLNKSTANKECIFKGNNYRITVITERLVRLEYNENQMFEDYPTELVWYRNFPKPDFIIKESSKILNITTKYFELTYVKGKKFSSNKLTPMKNLKIKLFNTDKIWYYGHPEVRNYDTSAFNIDDTKEKIFKKSLYSLDGFVSIDDSKSSLILENGSFKKRDNAGVDIYVFLYDKDFYYCLNDYFMLTGYPPLIPRYALGNWWDKKEFYNEFSIVHLLKKFEEYNIPLSLFTLNKWQKENNFEFNELYKDPKAVIKYLKTKNVRFGLSIEDPKVFKPNTGSFNKLKEYLYPDKSGNIPFNVYDAKTIDAFLKLLIHPLTDMGVDYFSLNTFDKNDLERLSILKHYLYYDSFRFENKRPLISAYNYVTAPHRYPILYAGKSTVSWDTLKKIPSFNSSSTNNGVSFWSHDIGGTSGGIEDPELFIRSVQLGVFSPIMRLGADDGKYYKREPWKWGLKPRKITIDFLNLRHKLIPYLYTEAYKYFKYGKPLIEPIYYKYPTMYDDELYKDQYFFGSTFLVSPITTKKDYLMNRVIQKFYIPDGIWYGFFTGKQFKGNKKYVSFYRDHEYPVFVKAGAIIPMTLKGTNDTSCPSKTELQIFPGASNTYSIYEDDGESNAYLRGDYLITNVEFIYEKDNYKLTILPVEGKVGVAPLKRSYKVRFKNTKPTSKVTSYVSSTQINNNCYKDESDLIVEVDNIPSNEQLTIICSGQDIEIEALRILSDDIVSIISDLPIKSSLKQKIDNIMFSNELDLSKKRIAIKKLGHEKESLEKKYIILLLKLLEYINEV
ncbi:MAG: DUF5110 domain-containing protein [Bacilli bacterium]|nr:DUF5110 domain-containing protein [Bacilli bacterium]